MADDDREEVIYHGTTRDIANAIVARHSFDVRETFFASTRELARYFAERTHARRPGQGGPVVVKAALYESDLKRWKKNRIVVSKGFDVGDRPELRGKTQLVFSGQAIELLNRSMFVDELTIV